MPHPPDHTDVWRKERQARNRGGRYAEWFAALALVLRGYRILALREKTPVGEIDLIACRGRRLAFIEVKRRRTQEAAEAAITAAQRARVRQAANLWLARHPRYQTHDIAFDAVFLVGRRWPRHLKDAL